MTITKISQDEWERSSRHGYTLTRDDGTRWQLANEDGATVLRPVTIEPSDDAIELALWAENDGNLYRQMTEPIIANLRRKRKNGTYDHAKALVSWRHLADEAAKRYHREHGTPGDRWFRLFPPAVRDEVAAQFQEDYEEALAYELEVTQ